MTNEMAEILVRCFFIMPDARCRWPDNFQVVSFCDWYCFDKNLCKREGRKVKLHNQSLIYQVFPMLIHKCVHQHHSLYCYHTRTNLCLKMRRQIKDTIVSGYIENVKCCSWFNILFSDIGILFLNFLPEILVTEWDKSRCPRDH
jgi:hypothetical protein